MNPAMTDAIFDKIISWQEEFAGLRRDLHRHPETAYEEVRTAGIVSDLLTSYGLEVHAGLARTGVVGVLRSGANNRARAIGLRADMDALHLQEENTFAHRSTQAGKMHGCGHDGHTTMLLAAARYLAEHRDFDGTVYFIFQPAEENEGGARAMLEAGLFERFDMQAVFGMHNMPGIEVGHFAVAPGAMMAGLDVFDIEVKGTGGHAAMPQHGSDTIVAASQIVSSLQTIVSRSLDPLAAGVVSVTQFHAGTTYNVLPESATLSGTVRCFDPAVQTLIEQRLRQICEHVGQAFGVTVTVRYEKRYPPTINSTPEAALCADLLRRLHGKDRVNTAPTPLMAAEDFAWMLQKKPGAYVWMGNGIEAGGCMVHNPRYDFNDRAIPFGAAYWVALVQHVLARSPQPTS